MEFILNLLLLNGKVLTRAAVNTVHEALQKCMRLQRKILIECNQASSMVGPFGNMLELVNYHVSELENEAESYLITGEIKSQVYDHFTGVESVRSVSSTQQTYKPISEPSMENSTSSEQEKSRSDASKPLAITRKRKLVNNGDEESRNKIDDEKFLVENLTAILKSQEFLFKNICKLMVFFEHSQLKVDPAKLEKIKRKLYVCRRVLSSPRLPSKGLDDKAIDDMIEGEITRCRLASAEISKIPYMAPNELAKDSKIVIVASNPNPMPIKPSKPDAVPIKKKKEDPGMYKSQEKMHSNSEPMNKVEKTKAQPIIIRSKKETPKPTVLYNQPQFSSPIKFPELQQAKRESNSEDKFKIIARVMRDNYRKRTRRVSHAPFRMAAENFYKIRKYAYNSELVPVYFDENFKPTVFKYSKLSNEAQLELNNNLMQLLQKNEEHFHQFEDCLAQSLVAQKFLSMKVDCLNMCKCNYYNKRHFNRVEARILDRVKREEMREHIGNISSKNLSHFNRVEARIAQNLAMDHFKEFKENLGKCVLNNEEHFKLVEKRISQNVAMDHFKEFKENLGKCVLNNEEHFNLVDKRISQNVARSQEAEVLDRNREMFTITDRKLQVDERNNQFEQLLAINDTYFVKAEKEIDQKLIQLKNDSLELLKLLPRSIEIERKKLEDELLLNMNVNEFDKFEEKVRTIVVDEVKNHLRCHPLLSRCEQESLIEKNREAFDNLEDTLTKVPIFAGGKCTTSTSLESIKSSSTRTLSMPTLNQLETTNKVQTTETIEEQICYESYFKQKEMEIATINKVSSAFVSMVVSKTFVKTQDRISMSSRGQQISHILNDNDGYNEASQVIGKKKVAIISNDSHKVLKQIEDSDLNEVKHLSSNKQTVAQGLEKSKTFLKQDSSLKEKKTTDTFFEAGSKEPKKDLVLEELAKPVPVRKMRDVFKVPMPIPKKRELHKKNIASKPLYIYSLEQSTNETDKTRKVAGDEATKRSEETKAVRTIPKRKVEARVEEKHEDEEAVKKSLPQLRQRKVEEKHEDEEAVKKSLPQLRQRKVEEKHEDEAIKKSLPQLRQRKVEEKHENEETEKKSLPQLRRTTKSEIRRKQIRTIIPKTEHVKSPRQHVVSIKKVDDSTVKLNIEQSAGPKHVTTDYGRRKNQEKIKSIDVVCTPVKIKEVVSVHKAPSTILPEGFKQQD